MGARSHSGPTALGPEDQGRRLFERLIGPRARAAYGPPAERWPEDPTELVHDTRVSCRRLVEALSMVEPGLPEASAAKLVKDAKRLRRALGAKREADVMRTDFEALLQRAKLPAETGATVTDMMVSHGAQELALARAHYRPKRLRRHLERVEQAAARFAPRLALRDVAGPHLYRRAVEPEGKLASLANPNQPEAHHALRVEFKRLRYTLEILTPVFPDCFDSDELLATAKILQDALGVLQDANDLLRFLDLEALRAHVDELSLDILRDFAAEEREQRRLRAEQTLAALGLDYLGACRRAAGRIGQLELTR